MSWVSWIIFGALAGWVASLVLRDKQRGCITNMATGILGAVLAGFIYRWATGVPWNFGWDWASFGVPCLGAPRRPQRTAPPPTPCCARPGCGDAAGQTPRRRTARCDS